MKIKITTDRDYNAAKNTLERLWATGQVQKLYGFKPQECPMIRGLQYAIVSYLLEACTNSAEENTTMEEDRWIGKEVTAANLGKLGIDADELIATQNQTPDWI